MSEDMHLKIRNLTKSDYDQVKELMDDIYDDIGGAWPKLTINKLISDFPEGQICLEDHEKIVGIALSVQVSYQRFSNPHTYDDLIGQKETILNDRNGDAMYGLDVLIHPEYRGYRLGRRLYEARKELCRQHNLRAILAGGRIPSYHEHSDELSPAEYLEAVRERKIYDPILSFQLSNDFQVTRLLKSYLPEDEKSEGYATLLEWKNIFFEPETTVIESRKTQVRIGAIQWQMREVESVDELLKQVEYFVDAVSDYKSDFAILPEFFNAPLMGLSPDQSNQTEAIRFLASFTERFKTEMSQMAVSYNI
ncbi:MAG: GNAT family N-acetyltransferase, partial [Marinomonas sp.]